MRQAGSDSGRYDRFTDVRREDGQEKTIRVVEGHLLVCVGCCCGNVERGHPPVPLDRFKQEWKERGIRTRVHLTISGCLGPCAVRNVAMFLYHGSATWFHSINSPDDVTRLYDFIEETLAAGRVLHPHALAGKVFERCEQPDACSVLTDAETRAGETVHDASA
jgi:cobaltochelatase CobN